MNKKLVTALALIILAIAFFFLYKACSDKGKTDVSDLEEELEEVVEDIVTPPVVPEIVIPLEVFFFDQANIPPPSFPAVKLYPDLTYTAQVFVADNIEKKLYGPYQGSTFPNNKSYAGDKPKTINTGEHIFLNHRGHGGSSIQGLNLIVRRNGQVFRETPALTRSGQQATATLINVHKGTSNRGSPDSRGSTGCLTIRPDNVNAFMDNFSWTPPNLNTGDSEGVVYVSRTNPTLKNQMISELKAMYD